MAELPASFSIPNLAAILGWDARSTLAWLEDEGVTVRKRGRARGIRFVLLGDLTAALPTLRETLELRALASSMPTATVAEDLDDEEPPTPRRSANGVWRVHAPR